MDVERAFRKAIFAWNEIVRRAEGDPQKFRRLLDEFLAMCGDDRATEPGSVAHFMRMRMIFLGEDLFHTWGA